MKTSELPAGSVIKFKNPARVHLFYEQVMPGWSHGGYMAMLDLGPGDVVTILKTAEKAEHVGQTIFVRGMAKVIYYRKDTFLDNNQASLGAVDLTVKDYYYDVISQ